MKKSTTGSNDYYGLHLAGFTPESLVDGEGLRATIFLSGCPTTALSAIIPRRKKRTTASL